MQIARFVASEVNEKCDALHLRLMSEGRFFHTYNVVHNRCLGWCREVDARQPLTATDGG
jgi:hypothetical protein